MTKQTINLLGGLVVAVILLVGLLLGVLPRLHEASESHQERDTVAMQNDTQQTLISVYAKQRAQLPALQAEVADLKQQIATGPHLEQLIDVASQLPAGAVLRSISPGSESNGTAQAPTTDTGAAAQGSAFQSIPVTLVVELGKPADATQVMEKLRSGPRLFAIDHATLKSGAGSGGKGSSTLTVEGRVFATGAAQ
ncbi:hypothetical protein [Nocardioides sp. Kera G14]|uniref:hypothetical protein n=1 Tax=Nocardioides sp. Kera G14 TaxID=2884264 RepID=UPI001D102C73|nr:hypothetical protein [Nocardioides sp. Kera G14]UDY23074.1 hypothetical protein LH076_13530 [Nocardioides sp. Kera G14]